MAIKNFLSFKVNMITFKAQLINHSHVQTTKPDGKIADKKVAFVELNPKDYNDYNSTLKTAGLWGFNAPLTYGIAENMLDGAENNFYYDERFFALTEQKDNFSKLEPSQILGLIEISKDVGNANGKYINHIQVNPKYCGLADTGKCIKNIGKRLLESAEKLFSKHDFYLSAIPGTVEFYQKCGFDFCNTISGIIMVKKHRI